MNQLPAHLQNRQRRDLATAAVGGISAGSPAHISIADNRFTLVDDAGNKKPMQTLYLDICVIDANASVSKIFFDPRVAFVPGGDNSNPPICWSDNGIGASAQASQPQAQICQLCPHNAWGSAKSAATGKDTKACNDVKKLAVIVPGMDMVFLLRIPPASLKNWGKYCQTLGGHGVDLPDALTRLEFESQGVLKFTPVGYVDEATAAVTDKAIAAKATDQLVGKLDRPWTGQADASKIAYAANQAQQLPPPPAPQPAALPPLPQAAPFSPAQGAGSFGQTQPTPTTSAPFAAPPADPFGTPSPTAATQAGPAATPRRTRGPNKPKTEEANTAFQQAAPQGSLASPPPADTGIPPFLQRNPTPATPPPMPPPNTFGMNPAPAAPPNDVQKALDEAFRLPT